MSKYGVTLTLALACIGLSVLGGCNRVSVQQRQYLSLLDAEKRSLEDIIYRQEAEYEGILKQLKKCRSERDAHKIGSGLNGDGSPDRKIPGVEIPGIEIPGIEIPGIEILGVEIPGETDGPALEQNPIPNVGPNFPAPPTNPGPLNSAPANPAPPANRGPLPSPLGPQTNIPIDKSISHIVINRLETRGIDVDRQSGDDGLRIVVEPRNKDEVFLPQFGRVSVVLLDPQESGDKARIARWDFDAASVRQSLRDSRTNKGIHLEMKWPGVPPNHSHLRLYVRLETETGERYNAEREIVVQLPHRSAQWTPRADQTRFADADANSPAPARTAGSPEFSPEQNPPRTSQRPTWSPERPVN
ncbi:MAG: hypothetical protein ACI9HK_003288 [Pirellulaceae bacterium]|jgi:hypothetical protein